MRRLSCFALSAALLWAFAVTGLEAASNPEELFECKDTDWSVSLIGTGDGKLLLITSKLTGPPSTANVTSHWEDVREGFVTGQDGGHQHHIRLSDGVRQIILFEGNNGKLTADPGRTYAGAVTQTASRPEQDFRVTCERSELNSTVVQNVNAWAERTGATAPKPEEPDSQYDGWF